MSENISTTTTEMPSSSELQSLTSAIRSLENTLKSVPSLSTAPPRQAATHNSPLRRLSNVGMLSLEEDRSEKDAPVAAKRAVYIRVMFLKIGEIDTVHEKFAADVYVHGKWKEPRLDNFTDLKAEEIKWAQYWSPKLFISNYLGDGKEEKWRTISYNAQGEAVVCSKQRVTGSFLEYLELKQFPFDTQDLTITVSSNLGEHQLELALDNEELSGVNRESFVDMQEWHLHSTVHTWTKTPTKAFHSSRHKHPALSVACKASRRPGFFIWNVLLLMLFICSLSFAVFAVNVTLIPNRLQLSFILLLTTVTFKFVVTHNLPKISYTTYLDKYILCSMIFLCCITVWHVIAFLIKERSSDATDTTADTADDIAFYVLISLWICFQVFFFIWVTLISYYNKRNATPKTKKQMAIAEGPSSGQSKEPASKKTSSTAVPSIQQAHNSQLTQKQPHKYQLPALNKENRVLPDIRDKP